MGKVFFLIVDDDSHLPKALMRLCGRYFLECERAVETLMAKSAEEALDLVGRKSKEHPDAEWGLSTDYDMPGMNGADLINALDAKLGHKLVWRLLLTSDLDPARKAEIEAKQAFVDQKPISKADLESYLYTFLMSLS